MYDKYNGCILSFGPPLSGKSKYFIIGSTIYGNNHQKDAQLENSMIYRAVQHFLITKASKTNIFLSYVDISQNKFVDITKAYKLFK